MPNKRKNESKSPKSIYKDGNVNSIKPVNHEATSPSAKKGKFMRQKSAIAQIVTANRKDLDSTGHYELANSIHVLKLQSLPQGLRNAKYAVRGAIAKRAEELENDLKAGKKLPFKQVVKCNIGNPQSLGMKPLSFNRQVMAMCIDPNLDGKAAGYNTDAIKRADSFRKLNLGAYSGSKGHLQLRNMVCDFMLRRDGFKADPEELFLTDGASVGAKAILSLMIAGPKDGILVPIPQYPLYSAAITMMGGVVIPYYTDEDDSWGFTAETLQKAIHQFHKDYPDGNIRGLVVINPGNPTGGILDRKVMEDCISICSGNYTRSDGKTPDPLVLIADEVYQDNIWSDTKKWESFRKVCHEVGSNVELFSLHSISKGYYGECGLRGGLLQCENIERAVMDEIIKLFSLSLCSNTVGQCMMASICNPPKQGEPSYKTFAAEKNAILGDMKKRAGLVQKFLHTELEGVSCAPMEGAMYAFPKLSVTPGWRQAAKNASMEPDEFYCMALLEATGVVTVAGSGFRQKENTFHLRMTILPSFEALEGVTQRWKAFHQDWMKKYPAGAGSPKRAQVKQAVSPRNSPKMASSSPKNVGSASPKSTASATTASSRSPKAEGGCWNCGDKNHQKTDCPSPTKKGKQVERGYSQRV